MVIFKESNLPELFYLDVLGSHLENFEALNNKNIFGYLRLIVKNFYEKKLLSINGLNCSILKIDIVTYFIKYVKQLLI